MGALITGILGVFLFQTFVSSYLTYWVDPSCRNGARQQKFNDALEGAIDLATRGYQRLASQTDTDQHDNFQKLFQVAANSQPARNDVDGLPKSGVLGAQPNGISLFQEIQNQQSSNVRIICDDDAQNPGGDSRWTIRPDNPAFLGRQGYVPNAQRLRKPFGSNVPGWYQEWEDRQNGLVTLGRGCREPIPNARPRAVTHRALSPIPPAGNQPQIRSVITLCNWQIDGVGRKHSFKDIPLKVNLAQELDSPDPAKPKGIDALRAMTATVLFHEMCHTRPHVKNDVPLQNPPRAAYLWVDALSLSAQDALRNVNNFVFLGLLAKLADRHFRLSKRYNDWHQRGRLVYDLHGITSRRRSIDSSIQCPDMTEMEMQGKVCTELKV